MSSATDVPDVFELAHPVEDPLQSIGYVSEHDIFVSTQNRRIYEILSSRRLRTPSIQDEPRRIFSRLIALFRWFSFASRQGRPYLPAVEALSEPAVLQDWARIHTRAYIFCLVNTSSPDPAGMLRLLLSPTAVPGNRVFALHAVQSYYGNLETHALIAELSKTYGDTYRRHVEQILDISHQFVSVESSETLLERFVGRVEQIDGDVAHVVLRDRDDRMSHAELDAKELASNGIGDRDRFVCDIRRRRTETVLAFRRLPRRTQSAEEHARVNELLERELPDTASLPEDL